MLKRPFGIAISLRIKGNYGATFQEGYLCLRRDLDMVWELFLHCYSQFLFCICSITLGEWLTRINFLNGEEAYADLFEFFIHIFLTIFFGFGVMALALSIMLRIKGIINPDLVDDEEFGSDDDNWWN